MFLVGKSHPTSLGLIGYCRKAMVFLSITFFLLASVAKMIIKWFFPILLNIADLQLFQIFSIVCCLYHFSSSINVGIIFPSKLLFSFVQTTLEVSSPKIIVSCSSSVSRSLFHCIISRDLILSLHHIVSLLSVFQIRGIRAIFSRGKEKRKNILPCFLEGRLDKKSS